MTNALAACNGNLDLPELVEDLLRAETFSWHFCLPSIHPVSDLSTGYVCGGQVKVESISCDVTDQNDVNKTFEQVLQKRGDW
jgi:hypothetical protein